MIKNIIIIENQVNVINKKPIVTTSSVDKQFLEPMVKTPSIKVIVNNDVFIVDNLKGLIMDFLRNASEISGTYCDVYTKPEFLRVIANLTKRKRYFFKAQALMILNVIEKFEINIDQHFIMCLECFAFYKKNLEEMN